MQTIAVKALDAHRYEVNIEGGGTSSSTHVVTVQPEYLVKLANDSASGEALVRKSFEFLLERESNGSILRSFDLAVIARYFPEYERVIARFFSGSQASSS